MRLVYSRPVSGWVVVLLGTVLAPVGCRPAARDTAPAPVAPGHPSGEGSRVAFGGGRMSVTVPTGFGRADDGREGLELTPPGQHRILIWVSLTDMLGPEFPDDIGVRFVRDKAAALGLPTSEVGGKVFWVEAQPPDEDGSVTTRWVVGVENAVVLIAMAAQTDQRNAAVAQECAEKTIPLLIGSLRK
jgi:hypothetical protein